MDKIRVLELFSGTGSVSKVCDQYPDKYEVWSLDICSKFHTPTILTDIMQWQYQIFEPGFFDFIWASPPCTMYSIARTTGGVRDLIGANKVVQRVLDIIKHFKPVVACIENPETGLLKHQPQMQGLKSHTLSYCRYSPQWGYR